MTTATDITTGLHFDMPAKLYHADPCPEPSLSSSVLRTLIEQTPAHAHLSHVKLGGTPTDPTPDMILGSYVHGLMAGDLAEFSVGNFDNYQTKAAKEWRDGVKAEKLTPILEHVADRANWIAASLKAKAGDGATNDPIHAGKPEVSAIWREDDFWMRARYDRLILDGGGFADTWDWKVTGDISADAISRRIIGGGYHLQAAFYLRGLRALRPEFAGRMSFIFAFVESEPPFAVRRVCLSEGFLSIADGMISRGIARWKHCLKNNDWPDDSTGTSTIEPPTWYAMRVEERSTP